MCACVCAYMCVCVCVCVCACVCICAWLCITFRCSEEEISEMAKALEKYGIQMPHFGKIGGILANEMGYDEAAS